MCVCVHAYIFVGMHLYMHVCVFVCMCVCVYMHGDVLIKINWNFKQTISLEGLWEEIGLMEVLTLLSNNENYTRESRTARTLCLS